VPPPAGGKPIKSEVRAEWYFRRHDKAQLTSRADYDNSPPLIMSDVDLRTRIKEMLVKNLMLQTTPDQIGDDLPLFDPNGLGCGLD